MLTSVQVRARFQVPGSWGGGGTPHRVERVAARFYPGLLSPGGWLLLGAGRLNSDTPLDLRHHRLYSERPSTSAETCTSGSTYVENGAHHGSARMAPSRLLPAPEDAQGGT